MSSQLSDGAGGATPDSVYEQHAAYERLLRDVVTRRHNLLVHGEAGAGKTRLLRRFAREQTRAAYATLGRPLREVLLRLLQETAEAGKPEPTVSQSVTTMKGRLEKRLASDAWILVLDQVEKPGTMVGKLVKDLHAYGRTPILFAGRSTHMEDIGDFRSLCLDKSAQLELTPWPPAVALAFAQREAAAQGLSADNLDEALKGIAGFSAGYPGRIVDMLRMGANGKYCAAGCLKFHTLYLDYLMGGAQGVALPSLRADPGRG